MNSINNSFKIKAAAVIKNKCVCVLCLQSNDGEERLAVVRLLAKLFGAKDSELASQNRPLWQCFLGRWVTSTQT